jgi:hypothetical protein
VERRIYIQLGDEQLGAGRGMATGQEIRAWKLHRRRWSEHGISRAGVKDETELAIGFGDAEKTVDCLGGPSEGYNPFVFKKSKQATVLVWRSKEARFDTWGVWNQAQDRRCSEILE